MVVVRDSARCSSTEKLWHNLSDPVELSRVTQTSLNDELQVRFARLGP